MPLDMTSTATTYRLMIGTTTLATFTECRDLGTKTEIIEHRIVGIDGRETFRKVPGPTTVHNVVLTRTATKELSLSTWRRQIEAGDLKNGRKSGEIVAIDATGQIVARWRFLNAWPSKVVVDIAAATEELTLAIETLSKG